MKRINVVLADDHSVVREGLHALLKSESDINVVGVAENGVQAVEMAERLRPDVVVMDMAMPQLNGMEATRQIREKVPGTRMLILSAYSNPACVEQVIALGASGYMVKNASISSLAEAIRQIASGVRFFDPSVAPAEQKAPLSAARKRQQGETCLSLTPRESDVLKLIAEGLLNKQVADRLNISAKTAEKHRYSLMRKLNIHDTAGLTRYAIASGVGENSQAAAVG
jgi:DNA-binding NarL/FixJ family response regulator